LGITALMWAAKFDHADICLVLIRSNSNLRSRSNESLSSLDYSILHGNYKSAFIIYKFDKMI
jgi:ankyrin repeat protein